MKKILLMIVLTIVAFFTADARNARMIMCFDIQNSAAKSKSPDIVTMDITMPALACLSTSGLFIEI